MTRLTSIASRWRPRPTLTDQVSHVGETFVSTAAERAAIVRSLRFLTAAEARAAATQRPVDPPRSPEAVADALTDGFAKRDVAILRTVVSRRCVQQATLSWLGVRRGIYRVERAVARATPEG